MGDRERMAELEEGINNLKQLQIKYLTTKSPIDKQTLNTYIIEILRSDIVKNADLIEDPIRRLKFFKSLEIWENIARCRKSP